MDERTLYMLADRVEIQELRARYCYHVDDQRYDDWVGLFTPDAHLSFQGVGTFEGHDEIRAFVEEFVDVEHPFISHMLHNPVIDIGDDTATGSWYFEAPTVFGDGRAGWVHGRYEDEYKRMDGTWKFASISTTFHYIAPYEEGWSAMKETDSAHLL